MGDCDVTALPEIFNMASKRGDLAIAPYSFEPEYSEGEESFYSSSGEELEGSDEEVLGRWFKCANCNTTTLNQPRECLCCREILEVSALADSNNGEMKCITEHNDFGAVCLCRVVLKTTLL